MKKILKNIPTLIVLTVMIAVCFVVIDLNVLPTKYLSLFLGAEIVFFIISALIYNLKKTVFLVIGIILMLISCTGNVFAFYYLNKTNDYINKNFSLPSYEIRTEYYLLTSSINEKNNIEYLDSNQEIDYYKYSRSTSLAKKALGDYQYVPVEKGFECLNQLKSNYRYLLISTLDYDFVISTNDSLSEEDYTIMKKFEVVEKVEIKPQVPNTYNVFISGMDFSRSRRDYNLIATVNTDTHEVVLTSLARDLYLYVPAFETKDTLTNLGSADPNNTIEALEKLLDIKIDYSVNLYTESLVKIVDSIGGVEFCTDFPFYTTHDTKLGSYDDYGEKVYVAKGCHTYDGLDTLAIARERIKLVGKGVTREDNCRQILVNIMKKLAKQTTLTNYSQTLDSFNGLYSTNINKAMITNLIKEVINDPNFNIIEQNLTGEDGMSEGRYGGEVWTNTPTEERIKEVSDTIKKVYK